MFIVNQPIADLKKEPQTLSETTDQVLYGMKGTFYDDHAVNGYRHILMEYGYEGYIKEEDTTKVGLPDEQVRQSLTEEWIITSLFSDVLIKPDIRSMIISNLPRGSRILTANSRYIEQHLISEYHRQEEALINLIKRQDWLYLPEFDGYIRRHHAAAFLTPQFTPPEWIQTPEQEEHFRCSLTKTALSYLGVPYRWGGKSPQGIDCSGLTFMSYYMNSVYIYRDAKLMEGFPVRAIPRALCRPGDLLYFPGHIAMYLDQGTFIHATGKSGSDGVVINSFNPYARNYRKDLDESFITAGTIFPPKSSCKE